VDADYTADLLQNLVSLLYLEDGDRIFQTSAVQCASTQHHPQATKFTVALNQCDGLNYVVVTWLIFILSSISIFCHCTDFRITLKKNFRNIIHAVL
jgi:hypothetical protein